jgi:hypothetical protein
MLGVVSWEELPKFLLDVSRTRSTLVDVYGHLFIHKYHGLKS